MTAEVNVFSVTLHDITDFLKQICQKFTLSIYLAMN